MWGQRANGSGRLDNMSDGPPGEAHIIPPTVSSWGNPPRSRSLPHLQTAHIETVAENSFFPIGIALPVLLGFLMTLGPFPELQKFSSLFICEAQTLAIASIKKHHSPFFIDLPPLSPANSYPSFKFLFRFHFQVRDPKSRCRAHSPAPTRVYVCVYTYILSYSYNCLGSSCFFSTRL